LRQAIDQWARVIRRYPGSEEASRSLFRTALMQETELDELEAAIETYRRCAETGGGWADRARARLARMTEPSLMLLTERTWRSQEAAQVKLHLRNVESVEVTLYALDLESYFKKHLTHQRVEELDLDLIAPDQRLEVEIDDYREYAPLEREVELPVEGPGVWAVAVTADELRATTLVIRSDVDVILKSSRREVLVFAQDVPRGVPAEDVRVLLALPRPEEPPLLLELETGEDGIARGRFEELAEGSELSVLAVRDGHYASDGMSLSGLSVAQGLTPRGHVSTDRSAYRPGDRVRWRAIVRAVQEGAYHFTPGARVDALVRDSHGRPLHREELALSEFGTVHGEFDLPPQAALGDYAIQLSGPDLPDVAGGFQVAQYQLRKVEVTLEPEREVYYRGEEVVVIARATYYYGEPVVGSPLQCLLPDGRMVEERTDAEGRVELRFGTRDFLHEQPLFLAATLTEEGVSGQGTVWLATHGYSASLTTRHPVVIAGDAVEVELETKSPSGEGLAREMTLEVLRYEPGPRGTLREVPVEERQLTTDEENGRAHTSLTLLEGGQYVLRAEGIDRFGNPVLASSSLEVSGDDDAVKLRLLADSQRTEVGRTLRLELVNRAGEGLALVTFEGETILGYRLVELPAGRSELELPVTGEHFPNFRVAAAMMEGQKLYEATSDFAVKRALVVKVTPGAEVVAPGAEAQVKLTVTDQLGEPVEAELALAVVDASLFDLYPDGTAALPDFFDSAALRVVGLRTTASCGFTYHGITTSIDQTILEEGRRVRALHAWAEQRGELMDQLAALGYAGGAGAGGGAGGDAVQSEDFPTFAFQDQLGANEAGVVALRYAQTMAPEEKEVARGSTAAGSDDFFLGRGQATQQHRRANGIFSKRIDAGLAGRAGEPPAMAFDAHTAFWTPSVVTDEAGQATLSFELPDKATRWRLTVRGVGPGTLLGEARGELVTRSELFAELRAPRTLVEGDTPRLAARIHNLTGKRGTAELTLTVAAGEETEVLTARVELGDAAVVEHLFEALEPVIADDLRLELSVAADIAGQAQSVAATEEVPVRPYGLERVASASGVVRDLQTAWLELPRGREYEDRLVELYVGPSLDRVLIDEALGRGPRVYRTLGAVSHAAVASDLVGACAVLEAMQRSGRATNPEYGHLRAHAQGLLAALVAAQNHRDGGWTWLEQGQSAPEPSARVALALAAASGAGLAPPEDTLVRLTGFLSNSFRRAPEQANERKATLTHALAALDKGDFAAANRLYRERNNLSPAALAHTVLALVEMKRAPMATELARLLEDRMELAGDAPQGVSRAFCSVAGNGAWNGSTLDMTALAVIALERALPASPRISQGVEYLLAQRPWGATRGRGMALAAAARYQRETERWDDLARLTLTVGDAEPLVLEIERDGAGRHLRIPLEGAGRRVPLRFELEGRAQPHFAARLTGFSSDVTPPRVDHGFRITRTLYEALPPRFRGRALPVGFSVLRERSRTWNNTVDHLPLGASTTVVLSLHRDGQVRDDQLDYLVLEIPLPGGARVLEGSVEGGLGHFEQRDGLLVVPLGTVRGTKRVRYTLLGVDPGSYRMAPPVLFSVYQPERVALGKPEDLVVLERGVPSPDQYRPSPDELYHHGERLFEAEDLAGAKEKLDALYAAHQGNLRDEPLKALARMRLTVALADRDPRAAVRFFEVLREKDPEYTVPFEEIVAVGEAYRQLGEFERAFLIFRATARETFGNDLEVAGTLREEGELAGALDTLDALTRAYPDLPAVTSARLALADQLLILAPEAHRHESLRKAGYDRAALTARGVELLKRFLAMHPTSPLAPDAGLNLVSAYLGLPDYETAAELAGEMAELYTEPRFADAFLYTRAVARWHLGREEEALEALQRIAAAEYPDEQGRKHPSENRDLALYILGQIHHARQDAETASEYYRRVEDLFADAREALVDFKRQTLVLEEVTTARPGEAIELELTHRNVERAELAVYAVDLMTLYLREKDLSSITAVNLAGIAPTLTTTVELGAGPDLRERESSADLALNEPGAYLVMARSGALHASGLVLVSDLELEVAEDPRSSRVRVQAIDAGSGTYVRDVDVRVIGSASGTFVTGETDPRGLFLADGVSGAATVVARHDERHYAFHRGEALLAQAGEDVRQEDLSRDLEQESYFKNVIDFNTRAQAQRGLELQNEISRDRKGVQVQQVK